MAKVKDLVAHLLKGNQEAEVEAHGYFGEPIHVDITDFRFSEDGSTLEVPCIDRGEEPT